MLFFRFLLLSQIMSEVRIVRDVLLNICFLLFEIFDNNLATHLYQPYENGISFDCCILDLLVYSIKISIPPLFWGWGVGVVE